MSDSKIRQKVEALVHERQDQICNAFENLDSETFETDEWERPGGGGGRTRVLQSGSVFDKAGVNVSVVEGELSDEAASQMGGGADIEDRRFWAAGLSIVCHPANPMAPTVHANYRYFERGEGSQPGSWWFGGGSDLTPVYLFESDATHFHQTLKEACDKHDESFYPRFKDWCDEYFYIPHRQEHRGVGGIFFDDLNDRDPMELLLFIEDCSEAFLPSYLPILKERCSEQFGPEHTRWQKLRRGRYVEFNLVYDRGTKFGLRTGGRTESILMSLPLDARWEYEADPEPGTEEARLMDVLKSPTDWVD